MERPSENTLIRYFRGECPPHETSLVELYLSMDLDAEYVADCMKAAWLVDRDESLPGINDADVVEFKQRFYKRQSPLVQLPPLASPGSLGRPVFHFPVWMKVAATLLIMLGTSLLLYKYTINTSNDLASQGEDILPGRAQAALTLADGSVVSLSDQPRGRLALQDGIPVKKTDDGEIVYDTDKEALATSHAFNKIVTPKGGQYRVILPDGTKAWLNAASSLSYPLKFKSGERRVRMTGEVYFEVAKVILPGSGIRVPFYVDTEKQQVQVLGTHFNVSAYQDEPVVKTTLLEGSVKVLSRNGHSAMLRPGQLAVLAGKIEVKKADMEQEMAWKNGDFIFRGETLESALRRVSRWYDVQVDCPEQLGKLRLNGMISRNQPLSTIIDMIQLTKLAKITVKERRLIVTD
ncbi:putative anti-sigma factor [Pedobacter sp. BAL39]|uniref:FecR family protein n=1 Tax=Pedobacter sp. BAL39 TaxID=391596 RepID=UPI00015599B3|nr:FecR domain-containing protein [Pedobacter sp. BAL39]EDM37747.1 putative anti-sigma factor [Pedobacter sp. BAL39]